MRHGQRRIISDLLSKGRGHDTASIAHERLAQIDRLHVGTNEILASGGLYGGTSSLFRDFASYGIGVRYAAGDSVEAYKPVFSADVRKTVYVVGLAVSFVAFVITGLSSELPRIVVEVASLIGTGFGTLAAGFGVAYAGK